MKIIMFCYFAWKLFETFRNTKYYINEKEYKNHMFNAKMFYEEQLKRLPTDYQDPFVRGVMIMAIFMTFVHAVICIYVGTIMPYAIISASCFLEAVMTIYGVLAYWKMLYKEMFTNNSSDFTYHKYENIFGMIVSYVCYIFVLIGLMI